MRHPLPACLLAAAVMLLFFFLFWFYSVLYTCCSLPCCKACLPPAASGKSYQSPDIGYELLSMPLLLRATADGEQDTYTPSETAINSNTVGLAHSRTKSERVVAAQWLNLYSLLCDCCRDEMLSTRVPCLHLALLNPACSYFMDSVSAWQECSFPYQCAAQDSCTKSSVFVLAL
jgi:hypothetical protein